MQDIWHEPMVQDQILASKFRHMWEKKKKSRRILKTILIYCEWDCEYIFLSCLKDIYHERWSGFILTVENGRGWSPDILVKKVKESEGYHKKYIWLDTDRPEIERARVIASKSWIVLFENTPLCLEGEILRMLGRNIKWVSDYNSKFAKLYPNEDLCEKKAYVKLFPKEKIEIIRQNNDFVISRIVKLLETWEL